MRLPQSLAKNSSACLVFSALVWSLVSLLPQSSSAATQQLSCSPPSIHFGRVAVGKSLEQPVVVTNTTAASATISAIAFSDSQFTVSGVQLPVVLAPGDSITLQVSFLPTSDGYTKAALTVTSNLQDSSLSLPVSGLGSNQQLASATPASLSFGNVPVGQTASLPVVISCASCSEAIPSFFVEGNSFSASGPALPVTISSANSLTLNLVFKPNASGETSGSLFINEIGLDIPLTGTGTSSTAGQLSVSPSQLSFGDVNVGTSSAQSSTLTASGGSVTVSSASSNNGEFSISGTSFPFTIASGQSTEIKVVFTPTGTGAASGSLSLSSNASNSSASETVSGTGVSPQYSVSLSWNASASSVAGYNVYRGTTAGTYSKLNSALDATTAYTDSTVVSGTTYYYAATSVSSSGQESSYSSPLKVSIP